MEKPKRPRDANQLAKFVVDLATGDQPEPKPVDDGKDPAAVKGEDERVSPSKASLVSPTGISQKDDQLRAGGEMVAAMVFKTMVLDDVRVRIPSCALFSLSVSD